MLNKKLNSIKIYLAGRIPLKNESGIDPFWRRKYTKYLQKLVPKAIIIDPSYRELKEKDYKAVFGHDLFLIKKADLVVVNAEVPVGLGTAQEIIIAKYFRKPIIVVSPKGSYYSLSEGHHPFLATISDLIIEDIKDLKSITIKEIKRKKIPGLKVFIETSIKYYFTHYFPKDRKTQEILRSTEE